MEKFKLGDMVKGWVVGDFEPSVTRTPQFEVAVKRYRTGDGERRHVHMKAEEITVVVCGRVFMNGQLFSEGDIVKIPKGESTDFTAITEAVTVCIKTPSVIGDKYMENSDV